jgi:hypothetical protein
MHVNCQNIGLKNSRNLVEKWKYLSFECAIGVVLFSHFQKKVNA